MVEKTIHVIWKDKRALPWAEVKEELIIAYSFSGDKKTNYPLQTELESTQLLEILLIFPLFIR